MIILFDFSNLNFDSSHPHLKMPMMISLKVAHILFFQIADFHILPFYDLIIFLILNYLFPIVILFFLVFLMHSNYF
jgi:hypothetical protein